jgi:hypothetical protein
MRCQKHGPLPVGHCSWSEKEAGELQSEEKEKEKEKRSAQDWQVRVQRLEVNYIR